MVIILNYKQKLMASVCFPPVYYRIVSFTDTKDTVAIGSLR